MRAHQQVLEKRGLGIGKNTGEWSQEQEQICHYAKKYFLANEDSEDEGSEDEESGQRTNVFGYIRVRVSRTIAKNRE